MLITSNRGKHHNQEAGTCSKFLLLQLKVDSRVCFVIHARDRPLEQNEEMTSDFVIWLIQSQI